MRRVRSAMKGFKLYIVVAILLSAARTSVAATGGVEFTVTGLLTDDTNYGGCMARVTPSPETLGLACAAGYVTFSCTGDFNSKSLGQTKFSAAQLAFVTDKKIYIALDDTKLHNGYCYGSRADNVQTPAD